MADPLSVMTRGGGAESTVGDARVSDDPRMRWRVAGPPSYSITFASHHYILSYLQLYLQYILL